jgi:peptide/nickel transport system permease protein
MLTRDRLRLIGRRLLQVAPVIVLATFIVFGLQQLVPGDIAVTLAGDNASDARITEIRTLYGLDRPFLAQYGHWLWGVLHGDLGKSLLSGEEVRESIFRRFPVSLLIVGCALLLSMVIGVPLGILAATRPGSKIDATVTAIASLGVALPNFWLAMLLVATFALGWTLFPATGAKPLSAGLDQALLYATLPATALAAGAIAEVARQLRSSLVEVLSSQYVRTLHAKGLSPTAILWKHGLKNVSVNLLTVIGLVFNRLLGATVVIEAVFAIPGIGSMVVHAAIHKDFPVIQGVVLALVLIVIALNLVIDVLYTVFDPRVGRR